MQLVNPKDDDRKLGTIVFGLYGRASPAACQNFLNFCSGTLVSWTLPRCRTAQLLAPCMHLEVHHQPGAPPLLLPGWAAAVVFKSHQQLSLPVPWRLLLHGTGKLEHLLLLL